MAPVAPKHVNLGDSRQLENAFDACIIDQLVLKGYTQEQTLANLKLLFGVFACSAIGYAYYLNHFVEKWMVGFLCLFYFLVSWTFTFNEWYLEKDTIGIFHKKGHIIRVSANMKKYDRIYNLTISQLTNLSFIDRYTKDKAKKEYKLDVQEYFNTEGVIASQKVYSAIVDSLKIDKKD